MISGVSLFNLFSAESRLSATNIPFRAIEIQTFTQIDNVIYFDLPTINYTGYLDVIILNEAGYGLLSRDSYKLALSGTDLQLPFI